MGLEAVEKNGNRVYQELHARIEDGDIDAVKHLLQYENSGHPLSYEGISALKRSFFCKQVEICSFLIHFGAVFKDDTEAERLEISEEDVGLLNNRLWYFNQKTEESCIYKLMVHSHISSGGYEYCNEILLKMYKDLYQSECVRFLMRVIENESPDIVYDFGSKNIDRIYFGECSGLSGITVTETNSIYIGAENLKSVDMEERNQVIGVVAEEFAHLALKILFENVGKPYRKVEESSEKVKRFQELVYLIKSSAGNMESLTIVKDVFSGVYEEWEWEYELIARVPHLMGIHGEEAARAVLRQSSELSKLLCFYDENIVPACRTYTNPSYFLRPVTDLESLNKKKGFLTAEEKEIMPLIPDCNNFKDYLITYDGIQLLYTNCTKLSALQIYQDMKNELIYHIDKVCLFFTVEIFKKNKEDICGVFATKLVHYLILVCEEEHPNFIRELLGYDIQKYGSPMVIVIFHTDMPSSNSVKYKWSDLTYAFKEYCLSKPFSFKGKKLYLKKYLKVHELCDIFQEKDITNLLCGKMMAVEDGSELISQGYIPGTYIERNFQAMILNRNYFKNLPPDSCTFISGWYRRDLQLLGIDETLVQWLDGSDQKIQEDKLIFINQSINDITTKMFVDFIQKNSWKTVTYLHYDEQIFYLRNSDPSIDIYHQHKNRIVITEDEMVDLMRRKRVVIISDDSGCGKSTVISSLIRRVQATTSYSLTWRLDLNKLSTNKKDPFSLYHIKEHSSDKEVLDYLFLTLGLKTEFEKHMFCKLCKDGLSYIFIDGFDEIATKFKCNALKLLDIVHDKTAAKLILTTRKHCQQELEEKLGTYSLKLVPLSREDQVNYLIKLWKHLLKCPSIIGTCSSQKDMELIEWKIKKIITELEKENSNLEITDFLLDLRKMDLGQSIDSIRSEIDDLDLTKLAKNILCRIVISEETLDLMGVPLHLYMIGVIHYDSNFSVELQSEIFHLYSQFIEHKILIYLEEKQGLWHEGSFKDEKIIEIRDDVYRIHMELSDQLIDRGKVCLQSEINKKDLELCSSFGVVYILGGVQFIHKTFAEFFKAESLKKKIQKDDIINVLFEEKYNVVRKFVSKGFQKQDFDCLAQIFFEDVNCLVSILEKIVNGDFDPFRFKIIKRLIVSFDNLSEADLMNRFFEEVESRLMEIHFEHVGGCLTACMIKKLLIRNLNVNSVLIFSFIRFSENYHEVEDILKKLMFLKSYDEKECVLYMQENINYQRDIESKNILKLLNIKDLYGQDLLYHALYNERAEIFAYLLKFFRDNLEEEQFSKGLIQKSEYMKNISEFINYVHINRICQLLKVLHSIFGNEIGILFSQDSKFLVLDKAIIFDRIDELGNLFEKIINICKDCFGIEQLRELLLGRYSDGNYLTHKLIIRDSNKTLVKILNLIMKNINDKERMKQLLKSEGRCFGNIFHFAAWRDMYHHELLQFCEDNFDKDEIKDMLLSTEEDGDNELHFFYYTNASFTKNLNIIKEVVGDNKWFKQLLKSRGYSIRNILYFSAQTDMYLENLLQFIDANFEKTEIKNMLLSSERFGRNVLHVLFDQNSTETLMNNLNLMRDIVEDNHWFKLLLMSKAAYSRNIFHCAATNQKELKFSFLSKYLGRSDITHLLIETDKDGKTCLHYGAEYLIMLNIFLYYAKDMFILQKKAFEEFILKKDNQGNTFLHLLGKAFWVGNLVDEAKEVFYALRELLPDQTYKLLLRLKNKSGETFLQITDRKEIIECCEEILEKDILE